MWRCFRVLGFLGLGALLVACGPSGVVANAAAAGAGAQGAPLGVFAVTLKDTTPLVGRVGERVALAHDWFDLRRAPGGLSWSVVGTANASVEAPDALRFTAPGPVRLRAQQGEQSQDNFMLAAVAEPPVAPELGSATEGWPLHHLPAPWLLRVQGVAGWQRLQKALGERLVGPPPAGWDPEARDLLLVSMAWGDTATAPVALTHRDAEGVWHLVLCSRGPYMAAPRVEARLQRFLLPASEVAPRFLWHDVKGDRFIEPLALEALASPKP